MRLHVGMPRAASTTLQNHLFDPHPGLTHLWRYSPDADAARFVWMIGRASNEEYAAAQMQERYEELLGRLHSSERTLLISDETFTHSEKRLHSAHRLAELAPTARVILIIRSQFDALESLFAHLFRDDRSKLNDREFGEWLQRDLDGNRHYLQIYDYEAIIDLYGGLFGNENVSMIPFEALRRERAHFTQKLCDELSIDAETGRELLRRRPQNARATSRSARFEHLAASVPAVGHIRDRLPDRARRGLMRSLQGGAGVTFQPSPKIRETVSEYYEPGNRRIADLLDLPLDDYGYPLRNA